MGVLWPQWAKSKLQLVRQVDAGLPFFWVGADGKPGIGLAELSDPLRECVPEAVPECRSAGIKVIMITGDYPATARTIAKQAGLAADNMVSGEELGKLTDTELAQRVRAATVFARILPAQKLHIVNALKANGEIVTMTGDQVNM